MKITTYKTNKAIQEVPESSTERRAVNDFFLTIVDGVLVDVEDSSTIGAVLNQMLELVLNDECANDKDALLKAIGIE